MNINLNIDQILEHVLPWDFTITIGGKTFATRRPSIGELGAMQSFQGAKDLARVVSVINALVVDGGEIRWEIAVVTAFLAGYLEYFMRHGQKKDEAAESAAGKATESVRSQLLSGV